MTEDFEDSSCPVCRSRQACIRFAIEYSSDGVLTALGLASGKRQVSLLKCLVCGHSYANPQISLKLMQHYYRDLISEYYDSTREPEDHIATSHGRIVNRVSSYVQHGSVMEVGCGYGFLLNMFSGDKWNRVGIEPSLYASSYAEKQLGLTVFRAELDYRMFEAHSFDAVLAFDLLEHLKDPAQLLALTKHYLAPHGLLVIGTGNISSFNARLFGHLWGYFGSWEHISFFSPKSMKYLLSKAGFDIVRCDLVSYWSGFFRNCTEAFHNGAVIVKNLCKVVWNATQSQKRKPMTKSRLLFDHMVIYARPRQ